MLTRPVLTWIALLSGEACLAALALGVFWYQDWQYSLPTPRPTTLRQPVVGEVVKLTPFISDSAQPTLLHFFNPACPCSQFNVAHVRELIAEFEGRVRVVAVLEATEPAAALAEFSQLHLKCAAVVDANGEIARRAGVYSTPQGVVLDGQDRLYYRGNYNRGRYCTAAESEFVRLSLASCLAYRAPQQFSEAATIALGCELPANVSLLTEVRER
jgi:protein-disulfide isomerase